MEIDQKKDYLKNGDSSSEKNLLASVVNIRCPNCFKLYTVKTEEIHENKPKFACNSCEQVFWIAFPECLGPEEVLGYPEAEIETHGVDFKLKDMDFVEETYRDCPRCKAKNVNAAKECNSCGVVFEKFEGQKLKSFEISSTESLKTSWNAVMDNYEHDNFHQEFIDLCLAEKKIDFAAQKYSKILMAYPGDRVAQQMLERIENLAMATFGSPLDIEKPPSKKRFRWTFLLMSLGLSMVLIGYFIPQLRNMVGVGVALMFLTAAVRFYFR